MSAQDQRTLTVTNLVCLVPMIMGLFMWGLLPSSISVSLLGIAPAVALPKALVVIGIPLLAVAAQTASILVTVRRTRSYIFTRPRSLSVLYWMLPSVSVLVSAAYLQQHFGGSIPAGKVALLVCGVALLGLSLYLPNMDYALAMMLLRPRPKNQWSFRQAVRTIGSCLLGVSVVVIALALVL